ncbi:MAG TPA: hypothetical protein DCM08_14250 [Microscillaceae bacterium]|jgi:hypothetical protein|nr:hypothetical protein [Microscillaceae bacterium]
MKKPKKITTKFFLNTLLNPVELPGGDWGYPLYVQITFNRKNTQIKCFYGKYYSQLDQVSATDPYLLPFEERNFRKMMNFEVEKQGDLLDMVGLGKKYEKYCTSIHLLFSNYLKARLQSEIIRAEPKKFAEVLDYQKPKVDFFTILDAAIRLFDNVELIISEDFQQEIEMYRLYCALYRAELQARDYSFPTVIDWINGTHYEALGEKLAQHFGDGAHEPIGKMMQTINRIVFHKLESVS